MQNDYVISGALYPCKAEKRGRSEVNSSDKDMK